MSNFAFYCIVPLIIFNAPDKINMGILEFFLHKSSISDFKLLKGLSNMAHVINSDFLKYKRPVTAPIDRPQRAIFVIYFFLLIIYTI